MQVSRYAPTRSGLQGACTDATQIVKERQMEFDVETDPDTLYEIFGDDYESFAEYVHACVRSSHALICLTEAQSGSMSSSVVVLSRSGRLSWAIKILQ